MIRRIAKNMGAVLVINAAALSAWLFLASALFCYGTGVRFEFPYNQWWLATAWWRANWWVNLWLVLSAVVPGIFVIILFVATLVAWFRRAKRRLAHPGSGLADIERGVTRNHGTAQFATSKEMRKQFGGPGCLIGAEGRDPRSRLWFDDPEAGPGHSMVIAGSGSLKTMSLITRLWNWNGPRVVFDPSLEIGPIMTNALRETGANVYTIGLTGQGINALDWIDINHPEADPHIRSAVDWIYDEAAAHRNGSKGGSDPFWGTWGRSLVTCLMAHMLYHPNPQGRATLSALRTGIATPEKEMRKLLRGIHKTSESRMARDLAGGLMDMSADETFSGIYSNAFAATEWLSVAAYADVVSGAAMPTSAILDDRTVVFIQLPLRSLLATPAVGRAVIGALFNTMFHADGTKKGGRILYALDEAWILGKLKEIMLCHATARKYRGVVQTLWQSDAQLDEIWGRDGAKTMRDTVSWRSYNAVQDGDVAEKLSRDIGEHGVLAYSEGDNRGKSKPWGISLGSRSQGSNTNVHEIKRRLIKADEIMRAPADEMFVLARNFAKPIRCFSAPYFRIPEIADRMNRNRFAAE